jgi:septal ring factor EnvC (AmiA/AmiB activator)
VRKIIFFLLVFISFNSKTLKAQVTASKQNCEAKVNELTAQRDSIQQLFNDALVFLDSTVGVNNKLKKQLKQKKQELDKAKQQASDQNARIQKLEADVKKLSQSGASSKSQ